MHRFAFSLQYKSRSLARSLTCPIRHSLIHLMAFLAELTTIRTTRCTNLIKNNQMQSVSVFRRSHLICFNRNSRNILKRWSTQMPLTNLRHFRTVIVGIKAINHHRFQALRPSSIKLRFSCKAALARAQVLPQPSII